MRTVQACVGARGPHATHFFPDKNTLGKRDPRVDDYIAKQQEFAQPILTYLREVVHEGCAECEETLKWSSPTFMYHDAFSPSHKREYVQWITEAKSEDTRKRRLSQAVEWMSEGKPRNWKYM
jgi:uncharacterized protein YdeI (YjbR/CyaY-like superfamily)